MWADSGSEILLHVVLLSENLYVITDFLFVDDPALQKQMIRFTLDPKGKDKDWSYIGDW